MTRPTLTRRRVLMITAGAVGAGWLAASRPAPVVWHGRAMGAEASIVLHAPQEHARPALNEVAIILEDAEALFSLYRADSMLARLNADGHLHKPALRFCEILDLCEQVHKATGGVFDPGVQALWNGGSHAPALSALKRSAQGVTLAPGQQLSLNGIAQGFVTDLIRAALARHGMTQALINIGEYAALGGPFTLGVADPVQGLVARRRLTGRARATSSPLATHTLQGAPHIQDLSGTRRPHWSTVSVEAETAGLADAASTAFALMSVTEIRAALARLPDPTLKVLLVDEQGALRQIGA